MTTVVDLTGEKPEIVRLGKGEPRALRCRRLNRPDSMSFDLAGLIQMIALAAIPMTFAITLHEAAHGYAARTSATTPRINAGRISLNPLQSYRSGRHHRCAVADPGDQLAHGHRRQFLFGWAKPVPVNFGQLRHPKRDMLWVAAAGPGANLLMALVLGARAQAGVWCCRRTTSRIRCSRWRRAVSCINVVLMVLNLFPLPPLDGGRIAVSLLPNRLA